MSIDELKMTIQESKQENKEKQYGQYVKDNQKIQVKLDEFLEQHIKTQQDLKLLEYSLKQTKSELFEAKDKIIIQDNDYKILLQEKSVIPGQFKQLQDSL